MSCAALAGDAFSALARGGLLVAALALPRAVGEADALPRGVPLVGVALGSGVATGGTSCLGLGAPLCGAAADGAADRRREARALMGCFRRCFNDCICSGVCFGFCASTNLMSSRGSCTATTSAKAATNFAGGHDDVGAAASPSAGAGGSSLGITRSFGSSACLISIIAGCFVEQRCTLRNTAVA